MVSRKFVWGVGLLAVGIVIFLTAANAINPFSSIFDSVNGHVYCNTECNFKVLLDFLMGGIGAILMLVGALLLMWCLFPGEQQ